MAMEGVKHVGREVPASFEEYNVLYSGSKSMATLPRSRSNGVSRIISQASSGNVAMSKLKVLPDSTDSYSHCSVSQRKSTPFMFDAPTKERVHLTMKTSEYEDHDSKLPGHDITPDVSVDASRFSEVVLKSEAVSTDDMFIRIKRKRCPLTPEDIIRVIGQRLFQKARHIILDQQEIFSGQIIELHRLIKVQRSMPRSPENLPDRSFRTNEPPFHLPPLDNKLLYANPLGRPNAEEVSFAPKLSPTQTLIHNTIPKTEPPYLFHWPIGNQWLVPIKSPSYGLVYKPFLGPCFPSNFTFANEEEPVEKVGLALFPMAPSSDGPLSAVVKVVPHNRRSAPESAARIFESLQEERRALRLSSCT